MLLAQRIMVALAGKPYFVGVQTTLRLSPHNAPSPDIYVLAGGPPDGIVPAERILLVVEVADTSLRDDLTDSASRYARHGVRDYWVVDVNARRVLVHRDPKDGAYPLPVAIDANQTVQALLVPELCVGLDAVAPAAPTS
jgi:Uma2 family endonuclease